MAHNSTMTFDKTTGPMRTSDFDYDLPPELIAQTPLEPRDSSRLLVVDRRTGALSHTTFSHLPELLQAGDLLVLNDSRVIPARLHGRRLPTGGAVELLLLRRLETGVWEALARPARTLKAGTRFHVEGRGREAEGIVLHEGAEGIRTVRLEPEEALEAIGDVPLPPYITTPLEVRERYQTIYARAQGSAAAPTAGLHFTPGLFQRLEAKGVRPAFLTLHVGLDTFRPVHEDDPREHKMHGEFFILPDETAAAVRATRQAGGRVVAVGTTSMRALESAAERCGVEAGGMNIAALQGCSGWTDLFILDGYPFKLADGLITNFHLPRSTLLMLVSAFASKELMDTAYATAVREKYRFYSFGDAMLIL